jgi:hypothetical protein
MVGDPLTVNEIKDVFPELRPFLVRVADKADGDHPDLLFDLLTKGCLTLHPVGDFAFLIAEWDEGNMHVMAAASYTLSCFSLVNCISDAYNYAKQLNCYKLTFRSSRKAFAKIAPTCGFYQPEPNFYVKDISYGKG